MVFDSSNMCNISKEVHVHDYFFAGFEYLKSRKIVFRMYQPDMSKCYNIFFDNVIGLQMSSCDFWGASPYVLGIECCCDEDQVVIPSLFSRLRNEASYGSNLKSETDYIEICITLTSGDKFFVACESFYADTSTDFDSVLKNAYDRSPHSDKGGRIEHEHYSKGIEK